MMIKFQVPSLEFHLSSSKSSHVLLQDSHIEEVFHGTDYAFRGNRRDAELETR
jgi:hypothetical protein